MMKTQKANYPKDAGQAVIEFILVLSIFLGFVFFFLQLTFTIAWSSYVQYATYMSARAFLSAGPDQSDQNERAEEVLRYTVKKNGTSQDRFPAFSRGVGAGSIPGANIGPGDDFDRDNNTYASQEGVRYSFRSRVFLPPFSGGQGDGNLPLTSEAWLGREPTYGECVSSLEGALFDNGC